MTNDFFRSTKQHTGVTWAPTGKNWLQHQAIAIVAVCAVVAGLLAAPAFAAKPSSEPTIEGTYGSDIAQAIGLEEVWDLGYTGAGIDVAVIDTGVSPVVGLDAPGKIINGPDLSFDSDDPELRNLDLHGHGTAMAGLVAGAPTGREELVGGNAFAVGAAPGARIVNMKVGDGVGAVDVSQVIAAIDWVTQNRNENGMNIRVMLLAYDTDSTQDYLLDPLSFAVENAWNHGIVVVVAGGNEGRSANGLGNPAFNPFVLAVSSTELNGSDWKVPVWGSKGDGVRDPDVVVPGASVFAPAVSGSYLANAHPEAVFDTPDGLMIRGSGTSQSAAFAAGAAAVLLEAHPDLTPDEVKASLTDTAAELVGRRNIPEDFKKQGHGMIDLHPAVDAPSHGAMQTFAPSTGLGSLEAARGSYHVGPEGDQLTGETTAFGDVWAPLAWTTATSNGDVWTDQKWAGGTWSGGTWTGGTWSGIQWSGIQWSGATWSGIQWSGATWSGATWSGATWSGATWSGIQWSGIQWSGATWSGATWSGATWSGATWSGATWS